MNLVLTWLTLLLDWTGIKYEGKLERDAVIRVDLESGGLGPRGIGGGHVWTQLLPHGNTALVQQLITDYNRYCNVKG